MARPQQSCRADTRGVSVPAGERQPAGRMATRWSPARGRAEGGSGTHPPPSPPKTSPAKGRRERAQTRRQAGQGRGRGTWRLLAWGPQGAQQPAVVPRRGPSVAGRALCLEHGPPPPQHTQVCELEGEAPGQGPGRQGGLWFCLKPGGDLAKQNKTNVAWLVRQLSWLERHPKNQQVVGSIPRQDTHLGCGFDPPLGCAWEATACASLCPSPSPLKSTSMSSGEGTTLIQFTKIRLRCENGYLFRGMREITQSQECHKIQKSV